MQPKQCFSRVPAFLGAFCLALPVYGVLAEGKTGAGKNRALAASTGSASAASGAAGQVKAITTNVGVGTTSAPTAAELQVTVLAPSDPSNPQYKVVGDGFKRRLMLTFDPKGLGSAASTTQLTIEVEPLEDSKGESVSATLSRLPLEKGAAPSSAAVTIPAPVTSPVELKLDARIPLLDDYQGYLKFHFDGHPVQVKAFKVTRSEAELPLQVYSYRTHSSFGDQHVIFTAESKIPGSLSGVTPSLVSLSPVASAAASGTSVTPADAASAVKRNASYDKVTFSQVPATTDGKLSIGGRGPFEFEMVIPGLSDAGLYIGQVAFTSDTYKRETLSFLLAVRWGWWWALGLALLGATIAAITQYLSSDQRPRLAIRQLAAQLLWQCDAMRKQFSFDATEQSVLQAIEGRILAIQADAQQKGTPDAGWLQTSQTKLQAEADKLNGFAAWVTARRQYASTQTLDPTTKLSLAQSLATAQTALQSNDPLDPTAKALLNGLSTNIVSAQHDAFGTPLNDLLAQIQAERTKVDLASPAYGRFSDALLSAQQADAALRLNHFDEFTAAFDAAGTRFAQAQGIALRAQLPPNAESTALVTWAPVLQALTKLEAATSSSQAQSVYKDAYDQFIGAQAVKVAADVEADGPIAQSASAAGLLAVTRQLQDVRDAMASLGGPAAVFSTQALSHVMNLRRIVLDSVVAGGASPDVSAAHSLPSDVVVPTLTPVAKVLHVPALQTGVHDDLSGLEIRSKLTNWLITGSAVAVAGVVAVAYLWLPNPVWGTPVDFISALFWGLGVHSLSTATFSSVLTQFGK